MNEGEGSRECAYRLQGRQLHGNYYLGRVVAIINSHFLYNEVFLPGAEKDAEMIRNTFEPLGFWVEIHFDLRAMEMKYLFRRRNYYFGCTIVIILSHGEKDMVYGTDFLMQRIMNQTLKLGKLDMWNDVYCLFDSDCKPELWGQPKIFILEFCQGEHAPVIIRNCSTNSNMQSNCSSSAVQRAATADFLIINAAVPGYISFASRRNGAFLVQALCKHITQFATSKHMLEILLRVNNYLGENHFSFDNGETVVQPFVSHTLLQNLYLLPHENIPSANS